NHPITNSGKTIPGLMHRSGTQIMTIAASTGGTAVTATGSPNSPGATGMAAAVIVVAKRTSEGTTSSRFRHTRIMATTTIGELSANPSAAAMATSTAITPVRVPPKPRAKDAVHVEIPSAGAIRKLQPLPGNTHDK